MPSTIRILLADDHEVVRRGLRELLTCCMGDVHFGDAGSSGEAIRLLAESPWDLAILDINMPGRSGLEVIEEARRLRPQLPILVLTSYAEDQFALRAFKLGASGYLTKNEAADVLITAVRRLLQGGRFLTHSLAERLVGHLDSTQTQLPHETLSTRELQVLRLIALGKSIKEVALELAVSEKTIATYRQRIAEKTGLRTVVDIVRYALKHGLVE